MAVERQEVLDAIKRVAEELGSPPGRARFEKATGIKTHEWYGKHWASWGQALQDAGFSANALNGPIDKAELLQQLVDFIAELGRVPSMGEMRLKHSTDPAFPSINTFETRFGRKAALVNAALVHAEQHGADPATVEIIRAAIPPEAEPKEEPAPSEARVGFVYLLKSGKHYKIGRTNAVDRRQFEIGLQLPEKAEPIHSIRTDDPSGIEAYWHNRFKDRRLNGEWFNLTAADVRAFKLRKFM